MIVFTLRRKRPYERIPAEFYAYVVIVVLLALVATLIQIQAGAL